MAPIKVVPVLFLSLGVSHATNVSFTFNNPNFPNPGTIGSQATFDIQSVMVLTTANTIQVKIKTDYQNANLDPFLPNGSSCTPSAGSECANDIFTAAVPEPGSLMLFGMGLAGGGLFAKRVRIGRKSL